MKTIARAGLGTPAETATPQPHQPPPTHAYPTPNIHTIERLPEPIWTNGLPTHMHNLTNAELVAEAKLRNDSAWREIVRRHLPLLWSTARSLGLREPDAADVCQHTWLALAENLDRIRDPAKLSGWLITTARHEAFRVLKVRGRELPVDLWGPPEPNFPGPEELVLADDRSIRLWRAFEGLTDQCRSILRLVAYAPDLTYKDVAGALGIPVNSLGPTRSRCLAVLRRRVAAEVGV
jgi:RNA polymerase sigma factor (sigma-70 family)